MKCLLSTLKGEKRAEQGRAAAKRERTEQGGRERMGSGREESGSEKEKQPRKRKRANTSNKNVIKKHNLQQQEKEEQKASTPASASEQLRFFVDEFQSAKGLQLSSLELDSLKDSCCILEVPHDCDSDAKMLGRDIKAAFGASWKEVLCEGQLLPATGSNIHPGSPAVLLLASSALRSIHLLRGFRSLTKHCHAAKLFSKHMKLEQQTSLLKNRVNIASGTPSRIKKLIDTEALGLSRLQVLVLDMHPDVKGYSLFTLPQVRDEFWDLFKNYFYQPMVQGDLRICLYGPYQLAVRLKGKHGHRLPDK